MTVTTVLVEPDPEARAQLTKILETDGIAIRATAVDVASALLQCSRTGADVVLIGGSIADDELVSLCSQLQELDPTPRSLRFLSDGGPDDLLHAIESGADGFATDVSTVGEGLRALARDESVIPPAMLGPLLRRLIQRQREAADAAEQLVQLTPREREVLALLVGGSDQQAIAEALFISPETARTHLQRVLRKLGVHSRAEAIQLVARTGLAERLEGMIERSGQ